jgi:transmembrane sensor
MDSEAIEETAAQWFVRRQGTTWTADDQARLDEWLQAATAHRIAFIRLDAAWEHSARLQALGAGVPPGVIPPRGSWGFTHPSMRGGHGAADAAPPPPRRRPWAALAASLLLVLAGSLYVLKDNLFGGDRYSTAVGGLETVALADGSKVTLNTDTRIRVSLNAQERAVELERGEAFFVVAKDASRPFVVRAGDKQVTAVGTQFSVRREVDDVEIVVAEGRVNLTPGASNARRLPTSLGAGAIARTLNAQVLVREQPVSEAEQRLSWRNGFVAFHETTLADAVAEFNRYTARKIVIEDTSIAGLRIGGNFRSNDADAFLWLIQRGFPITVEQDGGRVLLKERR